MFGSDYPHVYGDDVAVLLDRLAPAQAQRVLWDNANALYRLDERCARRPSWMNVGPR